MFGAIPKAAWQRRYPCDESNRCVLAMRSVLITGCHGGRIVLIDTGAGSGQMKRLNHYGFFNLRNLTGELSARGVPAEEVTDVILTHLHFDHCGYATQRDETSGRLSPAFPNAIHWISRRQWENCFHPSPLERDSYFARDINALEKTNAVRLIDADTTLCPGIDLCLYDGHTPGQIAPYIHTPLRTIVFAGDVIPLAACTSLEWISAYDTHPLISYTEKVRMLETAATCRQALIYCHDARLSCSTVRKVRDYYKTDRIITL